MSEIRQHQLEHNVSFFLISSEGNRRGPAVIFKQTPGNDTNKVPTNHTQEDAFMLMFQQTGDQLMRQATLVYQEPKQ